jgi:subtilisin family serine protease
MKRTLVAAAALVSLSAFGQATFDTHFRVEKADGTEQLIPMNAPVTDSVIVEFRDAPAALAAKAALPDYRATFARFQADLAKTAIPAEVRWEYSRVFHGAAIRVPRSAVAAIARLPYVKRVHEDHEMHTMAGAAVAQIGADRVWTTLGSRGKGVVVAVIDTGVDYTHEALGKGIGPGFKILGGYDFYNGDSDPFDDNGHGTHVSGIIAGDSATITGVAPEASLMAFKVLGAGGSGSESGVIAAVERALDPNGDGNLSDHVDVINLSLGGSGNPDDPASRALDNATLAGVVVCVASGNSGRYHSVSSPGTSRRAITVGAVDAGNSVASFSSRGPTPKDLTMKPEIGAPGVFINSSLPGNRYGPASGTSMATPHVAGACALLKALHPDWTPAQIKTAIMINAGFNDQETMGTGSGRLDVYGAATGPLSIDKPSIDLGLDPPQSTSWTQSRTFRVTNRSEVTLSYTVRTTEGQGIVAQVAPSTLELAPGAAADVTLSIEVDNANTPVNPKSLSGGGVISLVNPAGTIRVPWTFVKAVRATVTWEKDFATVVWLDSLRNTIYDAVYIDSNASETLLAGPGSYDIAVFGSTVSEATGSLMRASLIYLEGRQLDGDVVVATTEADASNAIRGMTATPDGKPLQSAGDQTYALSGRLVWPPSSTLRSLAIPPLPLHELRVNDISDENTLLINETYVDFRGNALYALQHPALKGVTKSVDLIAGNMKSANVQLLVPPASKLDAKLVVQVFPTARAGETTSGISIVRPMSDTVWNGRVFLTPDADPNYSAGIVFIASGDGNTHYQTPRLHVAEGEITTTASAMPWLYNGDTFIFGSGPRFATTTYTGINSTLRPSVFVDLFGPLGEVRPSERNRTLVSTYGADGKLTSSAVRYPAPLDFFTQGHYTVEATNDAAQFPDLPVQTKLILDLDSSRGDYLPPTITALFVVDQSGRALRTLIPNGSASLYFSAADYRYAPAKTYQAVRPEATAVSYRYAGTTTWTSLPVGQMSEDMGAESRLGGGILFRADLSSITANVKSARVELKIDLADLAGNTSSLLMLPAFTVGPEYPARRRALK